MYVLIKLSPDQAKELKSRAKARKWSAAVLGGLVLGQYLAGRLIRSNGDGSADLRNGMVAKAGPAQDIAALSKGVNKSVSKSVIAPCAFVGKPGGGV